MREWKCIEKFCEIHSLEVCRLCAKERDREKKHGVIEVKMPSRGEVYCGIEINTAEARQQL